MSPLSNHELGRLAAACGHTGLQLESFGEGTKKGVRWTLRCSCGWTSLNFVLPDAAVTAGKEHLRKAVAQHLADTRRNGGVSLPRIAGARL